MENLETIQIQKETVQTAVPERERVDKLHDFYVAELDKQGQVTIKLDKLRVVKLLRSLGYLRYDTPDGVIRYVYANDQKLRLTNQTQIVDAFEDYIANLPSRMASIKMQQKDGVTYLDKEITSEKLLEVLYNSDMARTFSMIDRLRPEKPIEIMKDGRYSKYLFFNNTCVDVQADGPHLIPYAKLQDRGFIWESSIVNRNFDYSSDPGDFEKFCWNISQKGNKNDKSRFRSLQSIIGYLVHDFYETDLKAVFLTDVAMDTASGQAAGRTGKGLLGKALSMVLNRDLESACKYVTIPGKGFDHDSGNGSCYAAADITTQLIHIEDIDNKFDFEALYGDITDGAKIRKLMQNPVRKNIKFMISSNRTIKTAGSSTKGRLCIFELANYYSDSFRPINEFGRRFFESDWGDEDWNQFYSFIIRCIVVYLQDGLIEPESINYGRRQLEEAFYSNMEFLNWFENDILKLYKERPIRTVFKKPELLTLYKKSHETQTFVEQKQITGWCKKYFNIANIPYIEKRQTDDVFILSPTPADRQK